MARGSFTYLRGLGDVSEDGVPIIEGLPNIPGSTRVTMGEGATGSPLTATQQFYGIPLWAWLLGGVGVALMLGGHRR